MTEERLTIEDRVLFAEIANDIKSDPDNYREAGKWLDEYCNKNSFRKRTEKDMEHLEQGIKDFGVPVEDELELAKYMLEADIYLSPYDVKFNEYGEVDIEATMNIIENSKTGYRLYLYLYTWRDAIWYFIGNWEKIINLGINNSRRILLMTWLLTSSDPETESAELNISKFEKMPSEKKQSLYRDTFDLGQRRGQQWMEAVKVAWQIVKLSREPFRLTGSGTIDPKKKVSLLQFMKEFCKKQSGNLLRSRRKSLNDAHNRKVIKLPELAVEWKSGQTKYYKASDLMKMWPNYCEVLPNLPSLKQEFEKGNHKQT